MAVGQARHFIRIYQLRACRKTHYFHAPSWWWIIIAGISVLTDLINPVFVKLQTPNLLVSAQAALWDSLAIDVSTMLGISNWKGGEGVVLPPLCVVYGWWYVAYSAVLKFLQGLGMYIRHTLEELDDDMTGKVLESIGKLAVGIVEGIVNIQA